MLNGLLGKITEISGSLISKNKTEETEPITLSNIDMNELKMAASELWAMCINVSDKKARFSRYVHHLPLKNDKKPALDPKNWKLSDEQIERVHELTNKLIVYVDLVIDASTPGTEDWEKFYSLTLPEGVTEILPPWVVFPLLEKDNQLWRTGKCEAYMAKYNTFIGNLSADAKVAYQYRFKEPDYWKAHQGY